MLAVAIHDNDSIATGPFQAGAKGKLLAEVSAQPETVQVGHGAGFIGKDFPGVIGRAVIDDDQFEAAAGLAQLAGYAGKEPAKVSLFLMKWHNQGDKRRAFGFHGSALWRVA